MRITVKPLSSFELYADALMHPLMVLLSGAPGESPQRTHRWNYSAYSEEEQSSLVGFLKKDEVVDMPANSQACTPHQFGLPFLHLPQFGGWKDYVVLEPQKDVEWHVGWLTDHSAGVSRLTLTGPVRMLLGPDPVMFFGVTDRTGTQLPLKKIWEGRIGDGGPFCRLPLL